MTDISATMGYDSLLEFKSILSHRQKIFNVYLKNLSPNKKVFCVNDYDSKKTHAAWLFTILIDNKDFLQKKLREYSIETNQVHFRNDKYSIFKKFIKKSKFPNMDYLENKYLVLPLHTKVTIKDANFICDKINQIIN